MRDDVEAYITQKYPQADQRAAVMQDAAALQASLLVDPTNTAAVKAASLRASRALKCLFLRFGAGGSSGLANPSAVARDTFSITTNTKLRLMAFFAYDKALDGSVISQPQGNTCE